MSNRIRSNTAARASVAALASLCWLVVSCFQFELGDSGFGQAAQARTHKAAGHKTAQKSSAKSKSGSRTQVGKRHGASRASSASTRSSARRGSAQRASRRSASRHAVAHSHSRSRHGRATGVQPSRHARAHAVSHRVSHTPTAHADAGPAEVGIGPRVRNYSLLARSYALYDQGINERLRGNYGSATDKLAESVNLLDQARSNQRDGGASTLESMVFFELAQAAEADGDFILARDSYAHCLRAKPQYVEAYLRIVSLLASQGQLPLAMNWLKEGLKECPHEPKLNDLSTVLSTFMGGYKPALERDPEPVTKPVGPETLPSEVGPESSPESRPEAPTGSSENEPAMP
ncbi:MAG: hypothetical protein QG574_1752 [Cyanobacteriota bacterium erpe_2018_sw_21hr_WHONDRS-SW48-000092_B_bin.40]|nr:hypothetical protein [Cyanobacteriota bacterium erpe_2018_sw_21hr_WHONDRS-SW48-000092_B_bin.40]